jgi:hypothetical protein
MYGLVCKKAPSQEFAEMEIKIPPIKVVDRRIFVGVLGIREESDHSIYGV